MRQARIDANGVVIDVNDWQHQEGVPCGLEVEVGMLWTGSAFIENPLRLESRASDAVQARLDAQAQSMGYDGILSAVSYAPSEHPKFGPEARALLAWRDACWSHAYAVLAAVQAGQRGVPTPEELVAELPAFVLPE